MQLTHKQLMHLRVETQSGVHLGEIIDFTFDTAEQSISGYVVKSSILPRPLAHQLIIKPVEVVAITDKKMTVEDAAVPAAEPAIGAASSIDS